MTSDLVMAKHLNRKAMIYIRQSTPQQVITNQESLRLQYALRQRASDLGWHEMNIEVVDVDLGLSGATSSNRDGFKDVIARVTLREVGINLNTSPIASRTLVSGSIWIADRYREEELATMSLWFESLQRVLP